MRGLRFLPLPSIVAYAQCHRHSLVRACVGRWTPTKGRPAKAAAKSGSGAAWQARGHGDKDDWEAELDPSLLKDVDPLAAAGTAAAAGGGGAAADPMADPFAAAASSGSGAADSSELTDAMDPLACRPCV